MSLRPIDWQLTLWNVEQKAPDARDRQAAVVPAAQPQEMEQQAQTRLQQVQQSEESGTDRPLEDAKDRPDRDPRGQGRGRNPRKRSSEGEPSSSETASPPPSRGGFDHYA